MTSAELIYLTVVAAVVATAYLLSRAVFRVRRKQEIAARLHSWIESTPTGGEISFPRLMSDPRYAPRMVARDTVNGIAPR
jgi:hypothetical protein